MIGPLEHHKLFYITSICVSNVFFSTRLSLQVLFKNLGVEVKEVAPTSLLKDRKREIDGNPDFSNKDLGVTHISQPQMIPEPKTISPLKQIDLPLDVANSPNTDVPSKLLSQVIFCVVF